MKYAIAVVVLLAGFWLTAGAQALRVFTSEQVGTNPQSGYCLTTNGVTSTWAACSGSGASSTVIKINGTVSNTGVPTIDFGSGITVSESPTDEFNLSVPIYLATSSTWTVGNLARVASNGAVDSVATSALAIALSDTTGTLGPTRGGTNQTTYTTGDMLYASAANTLSKLAIGSTGNVLIVQGGIPTWVATSSLGITSGGTPGGGNLQLQFNNAGTFGGTSSPSVTSINATSTSATSTLPNIIAQKIQALSSAGLQLFSNAGAVIVDLGAGGGTNATFYGGVNIDGQTRLATSLTGLLRADSGVVSAQSTSTLGLIGGSGTVGNVAFFNTATTLQSVATGTLTETATGLSLSGSPVVLNGSSVLTIDSGFALASTTGLTNLYSFYDTPSSRITAGANCEWAGNTFNCTGGSGGGGSLSTSTDIVGDGAAATVSYVTTDVMFGGSASTTAEFQFDKDGAKFIISSSSASASTTIANTNSANAVQFGIASSTSGASPLSRGVQWFFRSSTDVVLNVVGSVTNLVVQMHFYLASGFNFFVGSTQWNNGNFIEGAAIASSTIASSSLRVGGTATNGFYLAASSTASGGMAWTQFLVNLASQVTGVLPIANGGTGTSTGALLYKPSAIQVTTGSSAITTGDGKAYFRIPKEYSGMNLIDVDVSVTSSSTSGYIEVQLARGRQTNATSSHTFADMLSTRVTIDQGEFDSRFSATSTVIDTANDDVSDGDLIRVDVDRVGSGPSAVLVVQPVFALP